MLMAALRLNIPAVFVSGGPMEAGKIMLKGKSEGRRPDRRHGRRRRRQCERSRSRGHGALGKTVIADAGYGSEENYVYAVGRR